MLQKCPRERPASSSRSFMMTELGTISLPPTEPMIIDVVTLVFCLFGLMGNGIVFWFLSFHIKRNPFTIYIFNLAAADFGCLLCMAVMIIIYCVSAFFISLDLFYSIKSFNLLVLFTYSTSLYFLTAISTERCLSVLFPLWYRCHRPKHLSTILSSLLWGLSFLLTGLGSFICVLHSFKNCIIMLTPLSVRRSSQRHQPGKLYIVILLTVFFFLIFAIPLSVVTFLQNFAHDNNIITLTFLLASINSSVNPLIYFLVGSYRKQQFRGSIKLAFQRVFEEKADPKKERRSFRGDTTEWKLQVQCCSDHGSRGK
uniref:G-protein coupled receptors family 1 profile domain-containing protein n=1 Tax=Pelusios castaneus TaxID=367368 RepID=A0A8C8RP61_9SAUR